jgi:hypothetical protein
MQTRAKEIHRVAVVFLIALGALGVLGGSVAVVVAVAVILNIFGGLTVYAQDSSGRHWH